MTGGTYYPPPPDARDLAMRQAALNPAARGKSRPTEWVRDQRRQDATRRRMATTRDVRRRRTDEKQAAVNAAEATRVRANTCGECFEVRNAAGGCNCTT